jgi:hypothetical protein
MHRILLSAAICAAVVRAVDADPRFLDAIRRVDNRFLKANVDRSTVDSGIAGALTG